MTDQIEPTSEDKRKQLESLMESWKQDPCWDIEDTEGFEEFHDFLLAWRHAYEVEREAEWQKKEIARIETQTKKFKVEAGIDDPLIADAVSTFTEIEGQLRSLDNQIGDGGSALGYCQFVIAREQVRATLLMVAQLKRLGDLLEDKIEMDASDNNLDFMTRLYDIEK